MARNSPPRRNVLVKHPAPAGRQRGSHCSSALRITGKHPIDHLLLVSKGGNAIHRYSRVTDCRLEGTEQCRGGLGIFVQQGVMTPLGRTRQGRMTGQLGNRNNNVSWLLFGLQSNSVVCQKHQRESPNSGQHNTPTAHSSHGTSTR